MASIVKRKYHGKKGDAIKYYISYRDIFGKQHTVGGYKTLQEAKKHINDFENVSSNENEITVKQIFDLYFDKIKKKAQSTQDTYHLYYNKYYKPIEFLAYKKTDIIFWQKFFDEIEANSPSAAELCLKFSKAAANNALNKNLISVNKFIKIDKVEVPKPDINHLTKDELNLLLETARKKFKYKYYVCLYVFIATGMREGEIFALNKDDVDFENYLITVNKQFSHGRLLPKPKTSSSIRKVSIIPDLAAVLKEYMNTFPGGLLFPSETGAYIRADNFRRRFWTSLKKACGITKRVRLHDLRGSYIDLVLSSGLSPKFAQNQVGHARIQTTLDVYAQNNQDMIENANFKINNILGECCRNVVKTADSEKLNVIPFRRKRDISSH